MRESMRSHLHLTWIAVLLLNMLLVGILISTILRPSVVANWLFSNFGFVGFMIGWVVLIGVLFTPIGLTSDWVLKRKNRSGNWSSLWLLGAPLWLRNRSTKGRE